MEISNKYFDEYKIYRNIIIIDIKSFYASVECVLRRLNPFTAPLVVADLERGGGSVVLSVSPYLKSLGVPNVCRIFDLPKDIKIIYAKPRMSTYIEYSKKIIDIYLDFISPEDLHVYSVDESFLDVTNYLKLYKTSDYDLAKKIKERILCELGLHSAAGVGSNMLLAKMAMDIEAKKTKEGIAKWTYEDIETKLWPLEDLTKMWSIGHRMNIKLRNLGVTKISDIANKFSYEDLSRIFGIMGGELWHHVHGIDMSLISDKNSYVPKSTSIGHSQVLFRDYDGEEIKIIILEMCDFVCKRLRLCSMYTSLVHLTILYSSSASDSKPPGFSRQMKLPKSTRNAKKLFDYCMMIFNEYYDGSKIRRVGINLGKLTNTFTGGVDLFNLNDNEEKEDLINQHLDQIKSKYGENSIQRGTSLLKESTVIERNKMIGGHRG